jgi:hypothetical protein
MYINLNYVLMEQGTLQYELRKLGEIPKLNHNKHLKVFIILKRMNL